jgi:phosphinothricin acetyltransferase
MTTPVTIRPAQPGDFDAIAAMTNYYIEHTTIHFGYKPMTAEEFRTLWLDTRDRYPWLVAESSPGEVLGYAKAGTWRTREAYQHTAEAGIYVRRDAHGRGIGTSLYRALLDQLRVRGFRTCVGGVTLPNPASGKLHACLGFRPVGVFKEVGYKMDRWLDVEWWQIMLSEKPA